MRNQRSFAKLAVYGIFRATATLAGMAVQLIAVLEVMVPSSLGNPGLFFGRVVGKVAS